MRVPRRRESIFLRIAESKNNVDGRLSEQLSAQALVLLSCRSDRKAHALDFTDAVAVGRGKAFARLVHGVENGLEHGVLVVSAGFVHERVDLQIGAALEKADEFKRQNDGDGGNSCSSIKAGAARHADGGNDPDGPADSPELRQAGSAPAPYSQPRLRPQLAAAQSAGSPCRPGLRGCQIGRESSRA